MNFGPRWLTAVLMIGVSQGTSAQQQNARDEAATAIAQIRLKGNPELPAAYLTQEVTSRSSRDLQAVEDSLVAIVSEYERGDAPNSLLAANASAAALVMSNRPERLLERRALMSSRGLKTPEPYERAFDGLVRMYEASQAPSFQAGIMYYMTELPDIQRVVHFFSRIATTRSLRASTAVLHLAKDLGPLGENQLKLLYERQLVTEELARKYIDDIAARRGWSRDGASS